MTEKDINIEEEEKLDEQNVQENDNSAETEEAPQDTENEEQEAEEEDETAKLKAEVATLQDKYLRSVAEFDNYRKRTTKEKAELILNGGANAIKAILPVLDDMERAIANGEKTEDPQVLREGM
jgi:molecular chaperone GrpE